MITVDVAYRISTFADYAVANALCLLSLLLAAGRRRVLPAARGQARRERVVNGGPTLVTIASRVGPNLVRALVLALFAFVIFGPLLNLVLWAFAEQLVLPEQAAVGIRIHVLGTRVQPARQRDRLARHQRLDRGADRRRSASRSRFLRAMRSRGCKLPWRGAILLAFLLPQAVPNLPVYVNIARVFYEIGLNGTIIGRRARARIARTGARRVDRVGGVRVGRRVARGSGAQHRRIAVDMLPHVTLPLAAPGLMASAIFVFLESLDEFTGTYFVGVPDVTTLPLLMFNASMGGNYQIASITALLLLVPSIGFMLVVERFLKADVLAMVGR